METYLGDGVCADFDGHQIWLDLHRPGASRIALTPEVFEALVEFAARCRAAPGEDAGSPGVAASALAPSSGSSPTWRLGPLVSNAAWHAYCAAAGASDQSTRRRRPTQPVTGVTWPEAMAYAAWAGGRLPTEDELDAAEKVAGLDSLDWGRWPLPDLPDVGASGVPDDLRGVVWVWTATRKGSIHVLCGSSWDYSARLARVAFRNWRVSDYHNDDLGLRLMQED